MARATSNRACDLGMGDLGDNEEETASQVGMQGGGAALIVKDIGTSYSRTDAEAEQDAVSAAQVQWEGPGLTPVS